MKTRTPPIDPDTFAEQMGDLPIATDRLRLVGLDHAERVQQGRLGATERRLALTRARRADDIAEIGRLETAVAAEIQAQRSFQVAVESAEIETPKRAPNAFILHGRVFDSEGLPADKLTVAAVGADGEVRRFTCTDASGYFRMDLPVKEGEEGRAGEAVFLQVSDAEQAVLYRGEEAFSLSPGGVAYRVIRLSGERLPPCPTPPDRATMPNLLDRPESEAIAILGRFGLKVAQRLTQRAPERTGLVVSQEPPAGTPLTADTSVTLVIGTTEEGDTITVPDVVGRPRDEAEARIKEAGLSVGQVTERPGEPAGTILSQSPKAGTRVAPGSAIMLVVAVKPQDDRVEVPNLVGQKQQAAEGILRETGLEVGRVSFRDDERVGLVLDHAPEAGARVAKGTAVNLVVGRRSETERTEVPNVVGRSLAGAKEILAAARLKLGEVEGPENGRVIEQKPQAGAAAPIGSAVSVKLSREEPEPEREDFTTALVKRMAADRMFESLELSPDELRERFAARGVKNAESARKVVEMDDAAIQEAFGLQNRNLARSFRRMLREALESL